MQIVNWYKMAMDEVIVSSWSNEGIVVYIDGKRYFCSSFKPKEFKYLNQLIKVKAWGKAKNLLKEWPCISEDKQQLNLFQY